MRRYRKRERKLYSPEETSSARENLRKLLPPGSVVYTILREVNQPGTRRVFTPMIIQEERQIRRLTVDVGQALGLEIEGGIYGVVIHGAGEDKAFRLVTDLALALYPDGFDCNGEACPYHDRKSGTHRHSDGSYALHQESL